MWFQPLKRFTAIIALINRLHRCTSRRTYIILFLYPIITFLIGLLAMYKQNSLIQRVVTNTSVQIGDACTFVSTSGLPLRYRTEFIEAFRVFYGLRTPPQLIDWQTYSSKYREQFEIIGCPVHAFAHVALVEDDRIQLSKLSSKKKSLSIYLRYHIFGSRLDLIPMLDCDFESISHRYIDNNYSKNLLIQFLWRMMVDSDTNALKSIPKQRRGQKKPLQQHQKSLTKLPKLVINQTVMDRRLEKYFVDDLLVTYRLIFPFCMLGGAPLVAVIRFADDLVPNGIVAQLATLTYASPIGFVDHIVAQCAWSLTYGLQLLWIALIIITFFILIEMHVWSSDITRLIFADKSRSSENHDPQISMDEDIGGQALSFKLLLCVLQAGNVIFVSIDLSITAVLYFLFFRSKRLTIIAFISQNLLQYLFISSELLFASRSNMFGKYEEKISMPIKGWLIADVKAVVTNLFWFMIAFFPGLLSKQIHIDLMHAMQTTNDEEYTQNDMHSSLFAATDEEFGEKYSLLIKCSTKLALYVIVIAVKLCLCVSLYHRKWNAVHEPQSPCFACYRTLIVVVRSMFGSFANKSSSRQKQNKIELKNSSLYEINDLGEPPERVAVRMVGVRKGSQIRIHKMNIHYSEISALFTITTQNEDDRLLKSAQTHGKKRSKYDAERYKISYITTTICRLVSGAAFPDKGDVEILPLDRKVRANPAFLVTKNLRLTTLTVKEYLHLFATIYHGNEPLIERTKRIAKIEKIFGYNTAAQRDICASRLNEFGQIKLALANALIAKANIIVFDDCASGAGGRISAIEDRGTFWSLLLALKRDRAIFFPTDSIDELQCVADRVFIFDAGERRIRSFASPHDLKQSFHGGGSTSAPRGRNYGDDNFTLRISKLSHWRREQIDEFFQECVSHDHPHRDAKPSGTHSKSSTTDTTSSPSKSKLESRTSSSQSASSIITFERDTATEYCYSFRFGATEHKRVIVRLLDLLHEKSESGNQSIVVNSISRNTLLDAIEDAIFRHDEPQKQHGQQQDRNACNKKINQTNELELIDEAKILGKNKTTNFNNHDASLGPSFNHHHWFKFKAAVWIRSIILLGGEWEKIINLTVTFIFINLVLHFSIVSFLHLNENKIVIDKRMYSALPRLQHTKMSKIYRDAKEFHTFVRKYPFVINLKSSTEFLNLDDDQFTPKSYHFDIMFNPWSKLNPLVTWFEPLQMAASKEGIDARIDIRYVGHHPPASNIFETILCLFWLHCLFAAFIIHITLSLMYALMAEEKIRFTYFERCNAISSFVYVSSFGIIFIASVGIAMANAAILELIAPLPANAFHRNDFVCFLYLYLACHTFTYLVACSITLTLCLYFRETALHINMFIIFVSMIGKLASFILMLSDVWRDSPFTYQVVSWLLLGSPYALLMTLYEKGILDAYPSTQQQVAQFPSNFETHADIFWRSSPMTMFILLLGYVTIFCFLCFAHQYWSLLRYKFSKQTFDDYHHYGTVSQDTSVREEQKLINQLPSEDKHRAYRNDKYRPNVRFIVRNLSTHRSHKNGRRLSGISFRVKSGECFALYGLLPHAGKTRLLETFAGLRPFDQGNFSLFGNKRDQSTSSDIGAKNSARCKSIPGISHCPSANCVHPALTVRSTLHFCCRIRGMPKKSAAIVAQIQQMIRIFALHDCVDKYGAELTEYEARRVTLAMAFIGLPAVVLLDQPTRSIEGDHRRKVWSMIRAARKADTTSLLAVIVSTNCSAEVDSLADRFAVMAEGRLVFIGELNQIRQQLSQSVRIFLKLIRDDDRIELYDGIIYDKNDNKNRQKKKRDNYDDDAAALHCLMIANIDRVRLHAAHKRVLNYNIASSTMLWSALLEALEKIRFKFNKLETYTISFGGLDQLFCQFIDDRRRTESEGDISSSMSPSPITTKSNTSAFGMFNTDRSIMSTESMLVKNEKKHLLKLK